MEIYADVLFLINFLMNYILLWATGSLGLKSVTNLRLLLGALISAGYSILILLPRFFWGNAWWAKLIFSLFLILLVFYPLSRVKYLQLMVYFYVTSFLAGGTAMALLFWNRQGLHISYNILLSTLFLVFVFVLWLKRRNNEKQGVGFLWCTFYLAEREVTLKALVDTGNQLYCPFSGRPVMVAEYTAVAELFAPDLRLAIVAWQEKKTADFLKLTADSSCQERFFMIPFSSLGHSDGLMLAFRPDKISLSNGQVLNRPVVGICQQKFTVTGDYQALLHPELLIVNKKSREENK